MRLSVLAFDYDGTITSSESIDDTMRGAIAKARSNGAIALLVTGRILSELQRVAGALHFVDGVVAENGAVVHFPDGENTSILAPTIPPVFVGELVRGGIPHVVGSCLVDANADDGPRPHELARHRVAQASGLRPLPRVTWGTR